MAKSYARANGHEEIDWKKEIQLVIDGKESKVNFEFANDWKTCYTAQQSEMIGRESDAKPTDEILQKLGFEFGIAVTNKKYEEVLNICEMIDIRAAFLVEREKNTVMDKIARKEAELKELKLELKKF